MEENKSEKILDKVKEESEKCINEVIEEGINSSNVDILGKIIDIYKDVANVNYWKTKEEEIEMRYRGRSSYDENGMSNYGEESSYGRRGVRGTGPYSRYRGDSYGRRGVPGTGRGRYRGEDALEGMHEEYQNYHEGKDMMARGNYGAKEDATESLECMLEKYSRKISQL